MAAFDPIILIFHKVVPLALGLLGLTILIVLHELGHFLFCKLFQIDTPSFSVGFGPVIASKKIGSTQFKLCAIPLGGYVEMAGAAEVGQGEQLDAHRSDSHSFAVKPYYQKLLVMSDGIFANLLFAYAAFITVSFLGLPPKPVTTIRTIIEGSAAASYGLKPSDMITAINGNPTHNFGLLIHTLETMPDQMVTLEILRNGTKETLDVMLGNTTKNGKVVGSLGVEFEMMEFSPKTWWDTVTLGIQKTHAEILSTIDAFKMLIFHGGFGNLMGPIGIISLTAHGASQGIKILLILLALISINLAVLNLIPLPILDGGQIVFYTIEAIIGRELSTKVREYIHIATWILMLTLFLYLSLKDLMRIFSPYLEKLFYRM